MLSTRSDAKLNLGAVDNEKSKQTALHKVALCLHADRLVNDQKTNYGECLKLLLKHSNKAIIDQRDNHGNTALHFAARSGMFYLSINTGGGLFVLYHFTLTGNEEAVLLILDKSPNLLLKNERKQTALELILPSTLETFMNRCIEVPMDVGESWKDFYVMFNYNFLAPADDEIDESLTSLLITTAKKVSIHSNPPKLSAMRRCPFAE